MTDESAARRGFARASGGGFPRALLILAASAAVGGATSFAQALLPDWLSSLANSASGWTLITALLVYAARLRPWASTLLGGGSFVLLVLGYTVVSGWRGFPYDPLLFLVVGIVAGPFVGLASAWLRASGMRAALGVSLLSGIAIGEAIYGLTVIGDTTSPVYWIIIGIAGIALLVGMLVRRIRGILPVIVALAGTAAIAALFIAAYLGLGSVAF